MVELSHPPLATTSKFGKRSSAATGAIMNVYDIEVELLDARSLCMTRNGRLVGCARLQELLFNMATAAYKTIPAQREHQRRLASQSAPEPRSYAGNE